MSIKAGRFFRAGTQGQGFFKAETGSDARIKRSYAELFKSQPGADPDTYGLGLHSGGGEDIFDKNPEPSHRMSDLMPLGSVIQETIDRTGRTNVSLQGMVSHWVNDDRDAQKAQTTENRKAQGKSPGWGMPNFPKAVTPQEWSLRGKTQNQLWRRSDVENWLDANTKEGPKSFPIKGKLSSWGGVRGKTPEDGE
jgi:hypothetical protein|tara:strand:+ start:2519 stop:3100 length:582 start_codon:yes stop_codon:yes gene_type:complete